MYYIILAYPFPFCIEKQRRYMIDFTMYTCIVISKAQNGQLLAAIVFT